MSVFSAAREKLQKLRKHPRLAMPAEAATKYRIRKQAEEAEGWREVGEDGPPGWFSDEDWGIVHD